MRKAIHSPLLALALVAALAGTVLATPANNFGPPVPLSRGTHREPVHYNTGAVKFQTKGAVDFVTQQITIGPGGSSGWHSHPGVVLVTVASGSLVRYEADCSSNVYTANTGSSAFSESGNGAGLVRNETTSSATVYVTFLVPAGTTALRIDQPNPGCPQN